MELTHDVVPCLDDNTQLSIEQYRGKLYEVTDSSWINHGRVN